MTKVLIQSGLRRGRVANRVGWALLLVFSTVLLVSLAVGIRNLHAA